MSPVDAPDGGPADTRRTALITGASAGIGAAFAEELASRGYDLVLTARRAAPLHALADRVTRTHGARVHVVPLDLAEHGAPRRLVDTLVGEGIVVDALVNNAGYGVSGRYLRHPWETHEAFLNVMVLAVAELTHRLVAGMVDRRFGRIINVASLAAFTPPAAGHTLYGASKSFVVRLSESLAAEVAASGVRVCALCPGFTRTEFHDVNGMRARVSRMPSFLWMDAARVAREGCDAVEAGRVIHIPGRVNRAIAMLSAQLPGALVRSVNRYASRTYRNAD